MEQLLSNGFYDRYVSELVPQFVADKVALPKVSIVTSFYNGNELIFDTAKCMLSQTFQDFEWLVVNDGSTNASSLETLKEFSKLDGRIKIINHEKNKGLSAGRNTGIKAAKGQYIFFIDSDDLLDVTALEKFYLFLQVNTNFAFANSFVTGFGNQNYLWPKGFEQRERFLQENFNTATFMARKEVFDKILFDEEIRGGYEDWDFWLQAASNGFWGFTIPEYLFWYRRNDHAAKWENWQSTDNQEKFIARLNQKYANAFDAVEPYNSDLNKKYKNVAIVPEKIKPYLVGKSKKKKVVFVLPWLNLGGADKFNLDLMGGLLKYNWDISIITTLKSNHPWQEQFSEHVKSIIHLSALGGYQHYLSYLELYVEAHNPDLILVSNSMHGYYSLPFLKNRFPHIPITDYIHCDDPDWINGGYPRLNTIFSHLLDKTIVASKQLKGWIEKRSKTDKKNASIDVCYINIDTKKTYRNPEVRAKIRGEWNIGDDFKIILYAARLTDQKQPFVMLEAIRQLFQQADNFVCIVCGDGPHFDELKRKVEEQGLLNKIWIMGAMQHQQVLDLMDASDIFFLPSKYEGIALSIYESIAKELLVVGANVGGQKELVTEDCGFLIEPSNPEDEAAEYAHILADAIKPGNENKKLIGTALTKLKTKFDIELMYKQMNDLMLDTIQNYKSKEYPISAADFTYLYNAFWNKDLITNEIWNEYLYVKNQLINANPEIQLHETPNEDWYRSEHDKLKSWYYEQYEVLPLWYKRFGHVLKVLKGKRKFSSLLKRRAVN